MADGERAKEELPFSTLFSAVELTIPKTLINKFNK